MEHCSDCAYWVCDHTRATINGVLENPPHYWKGACCRHAPVQPLKVRGFGQGTYDHEQAREREWPRTSPDEGCGDFVRAT